MIDQVETHVDTSCESRQITRAMELIDDTVRTMSNTCESHEITCETK